MYDDGSGASRRLPLPFTARKTRELSIQELDRQIALAEQSLVHANDFFLTVSIGDTVREFVELRSTIEVNTAEYRTLVAAADHIRRKLLSQQHVLQPIAKLNLEKAHAAAEETIAIADQRHEKKQLAAVAVIPAPSLVSAVVENGVPKSFIEISAQPEAVVIAPPPPRAASYRIIRASLSPPPVETGDRRNRQDLSQPPAQQHVEATTLFASPTTQQESINRRSSASVTIPTRHTSEAFVRRQSPTNDSSPVMAKDDHAYRVSAPLPQPVQPSAPRIILPSRIEYRSASSSPDRRRLVAEPSVVGGVPAGGSLPSTIAELNELSPAKNLSPARAGGAVPTPQGSFLPLPASDSLILSPSTPSGAGPTGLPQEHLVYQALYRHSPFAPTPASNMANAGTSRGDPLSRVDSTVGNCSPPALTPVNAALPPPPSEQVPQPAPVSTAAEATQQILLSELQRLATVVGSLADRISSSDQGRIEQARRLDDLAELTKRNSLISESLQHVSERCMRTETSVLSFGSDMKAISARLIAIEKSVALGASEQQSAGTALVDGRFRQVASSNSSRAQSPTSAGLRQNIFPPQPKAFQHANLALAGAGAVQEEVRSPPFRDVTPSTATVPSPPHAERSFPPNSAGSPARSLRGAVVTTTSALVDSRSRESSPQLLVPPPLASSGAADAYLRRVNSALSDSPRLATHQNDLPAERTATRTAESIS